MTGPDERTAGVVSRAVAAVVDLVVVGALLALLYVGLILTRLALHPGAFRFPALNLVFSGTVAFGAAVLYLTGCWAVSGCTAGAVVMGLKVVSRAGRRLAPLVALLRAAACVVFPLGLAWVAVDARRRSLQDIAFGSRVVYVRP
ncbi:RDD family protein [Mycolicibacterium rufum]|uniref:RDD family protein n=1 Tax=Mycolicibacterium rufum TaxID=318424 RepID=A0A9X3BKF7_9MYCO|nr:RDD family protein [Mycolicibacterium rufum]KGI70275.1 RDD domain-containing protein [Mycolicibacterium rufum]MCV7074228.1 RDD family protein [Mycolicibacterium rufum]ULP36573.1 RDD family protein [Mycolicibacterium rufum]